MPFAIGLSGINASFADLKTTGNNIANAGTIGFKASRAEFANVYALSKFGASATAIGSGVKVSAIAQQFSQGNTEFTENNLDLAINGDGFFNFKEASGSLVYGRNGQFKVDADGYIVSNQSARLQGYQIKTDSATGDTSIDTGTIGDLQLTTSQIQPKSTSTASMIANLDSSSPAIAGTTNPVPTPPVPTALAADTATIDPDNPLSYTHTTSLTTYDSLGNAMLTSIYYQMNDPNQRSWTIGVRTVDGSGNPIPADTPANTTAVPPTPAIKRVQGIEGVTFDVNGQIEKFSGGTPATSTIFSIDLGKINAANTPQGADVQQINFDLSGLTQYGAKFSVNDLKQSGYSTGNLSGIEVDTSGIIQARFTNGVAKKLGQVVLSGFPNPQGLGQLGNNTWSQSFSSGDPVVNVPGGGTLGLLQSGALEGANVNLTEELIGLIIAQRNFQANAKTITTADQLAQTVIQI